jgi:hypothetical protein
MDETEASTSDPTVASPQAADAPTDLHEPVGVEPTLAYSDEPDQDDSGRRRGWFVVPVFVGALVAFAFAVGAGCWLWIGAHHTTPTHPVAAPPSPPPPPSMPTVTIAPPPPTTPPAAPAPPPAPQAAPDSRFCPWSSQCNFLSPSHNISCEIDYKFHGAPDAVFCYSITPPQSVTMYPGGAFTPCPGENCLANAAQNTPTLEYGQTIGLGPFSCLSETSGVTCSVASGRGFSISSSGITPVG